jgi:hypothetical protein
MPPQGACPVLRRILLDRMSMRARSARPGLCESGRRGGPTRAIWALLLVGSVVASALIGVGSNSLPGAISKAIGPNEQHVALSLRTLKPASVPGGEVSSCGVLNSSTIDGLVTYTYATLPNGSLPNQSSVDTGIAQIWSILCENPTFVALIEVEGASNFSFGLITSARNGTVVPTFMIVWVSGNTTYQEYWAGNLTTGQVTGPYLISHSVVYAGQPRARTNPFQEQLFFWTTLGVAATAIVLVVAFLAVRRRQRGGEANTDRAGQDPGRFGAPYPQEPAEATTVETADKGTTDSPRNPV